MINRILDLIRTVSVYLDVDGTLVNRIDGQFQLTALGEAVKASGLAVKIATLGGWDKESLANIGILTEEILTAGELIARGWLDDDCRKALPSEHILVDNEDHPETIRMIHIPNNNG
jgi:hypothetical protein